MDRLAPCKLHLIHFNGIMYGWFEKESKIKIFFLSSKKNINATNDFMECE